MSVHTMTLDDQELRLLHESVNIYVSSFSHDQPDLLRAGKHLRAKIEGEMAQPGDTLVSGSPTGVQPPR